MVYDESPQEVWKIVKSNLKNNVRVISPDDFRKGLLPLEKDFGRELESVKNQLYSKGRWSAFPKPRKKGLNESKFYGPIVNIAQAVTQACQMCAPKDGVKRDWINCHTNEADEIRPSIVQVSASTSSDFRQVNEGLCNPKVRRNEKKELSSIWWTQIHTFFDVKPRRPEKAENWIVDLCSYILQIFRGQSDRRFVIALLLCGEELTMWYCDRVGLVGTIDPMNIHDEPDEFLKVLAALSILPTHKLGWDTTMKVYPKNGTVAVPSYSVFQNCHPSTFTWSISMPSEENPDLREEFITIRPLLAVNVHGICGRGSGVWEVVKKEDIKTSHHDLRQHPIYVLKQAWQPVDKDAEGYGGVSEAKMYAIAGMSEDRIYSYETVNTGNVAFSTESFRGNWKIQTYRKAVEELEHERNNTGKSSCVLEDKTKVIPYSRIRSSEQPFAYIPLFPTVYRDIFHVDGDFKDDDVEKDTLRLHPRALVRVLMKKRGYSLESFVDNVELVTVLRDVVLDHKRLYDKGILHRDISIGNILICDDDETRDSGMLIDLDHAKYSTKKITLPQHSITDEKMEYLRSMLDPEGIVDKFDIGVVSKAWSAFNAKLWPTASYLDNVLEGRHELNGASIDTATLFTANQLNWPSKFETEMPDFNTREESEAGPIGTIPFIGAELVQSYCVNIDLGIPVHNAVHDMESLLWVLVYICLSHDRKKEGSSQPELQPEPGMATDRTELFRKLFEQDPRDARERFQCLRATMYFEDRLEYVYPYFSCLKPLLSKWRWTLYLARRHLGVEHQNIHSIILVILDEAIANLKQDRDDSMALDAKRKRRKDYDDRRSIRQIPDVDGKKRGPEHLGEYSPVPEDQDHLLLPSISHAPQDSPSSAPKRKRSRRMT